MDKTQDHILVPRNQHRYKSKELALADAEMHPSSLQQSYTGKHLRRNVTAGSCFSAKGTTAREAKELADIDEQIQRCRDVCRELQQIPDFQPMQEEILSAKSLAREREIALNELTAKRAAITRYYDGLRAKSADDAPPIEKDAGDKGDKDTQSAQRKVPESGRRAEGSRKPTYSFREPEPVSVPAKVLEKG
jgi:hypothetical protein